MVKRKQAKPTNECFTVIIQDSRDVDESMVQELSESVDDGMDALVRYYRAVPGALATLVYWRIERNGDKLTMARGTLADIPVEGRI